ncbi:MAG: hypothetical protein NC905_05995 [Candidatus Omnitrophica bacterium]|nr:hypothetical protein [Candidatus Omnitrophota bacterium]
MIIEVQIKEIIAILIIFPENIVHLLLRNYYVFVFIITMVFCYLYFPERR